MNDLSSELEFRVFAHGLDHSECVTVGPSGDLFAGGEAGQIYRIPSSNVPTEIARTGGFVLGLCVDANEAVYACDPELASIVRVDAHGVTPYVHGPDSTRIRSPNSCAFDKSGGLYVSDSGQWDAATGQIARIDRFGNVDILLEGLPGVPNGIALGPQEQHLYVAFSRSGKLGRVPLDGQPTIEYFEQLSDAIPDGLAFDEAGRLFVSCYAPNAIFRGSPGGEFEVVASDWRGLVLTNPTNLVFAGPTRTTLVVANLGGRHLSAAEVDVPGLPLAYPM